MEKASFWKRFLAYYIDSLIVGLIGIGMGFSGIGGKMVWIPGMLVSGAYFVFFWVKQDGQTLGKKLLAIKVVKEKGKLDFATAVIRYIGYIISGLILNLGFIWAAFDGKKQGWHDKMAGTIVVNTKGKSYVGIAVAIFVVSMLLVIVFFVSIVAAGILLFSNYKNTKNQPGKMQFDKQYQYQQQSTESTY